ncbi:unnamed protein product [Fraxinus pennsylvanica]|uniref:Uncharacterized protein n=1 Tax=Fraxinus pennsylvanica TaxID=56036 RepID=A0AAD1ZL22_9LAMI|nr:unnamed protein product [Fraxinus pennsylvanica]
MAATTSTTFCNFNSRGNSMGPRVRSSSDHGSQGCTTKLDGVAMWLINGFTSAFFASLERCSCIRISTHEDEYGYEANNLPLIFNDGNVGDDGVRRQRQEK